LFPLGLVYLVSDQPVFHAGWPFYLSARQRHNARHCVRAASEGENGADLTPLATLATG
jgi:hypothetical protein